MGALERRFVGRYCAEFGCLYSQAGTLRVDFDGRSVGDTQPKVVHLWVGQCNAAPSPIANAMGAPHPAKPIPEPVNHDCTPGVVAALAGAQAVLGIRVGDVHGQVIAAVRIPVIEAIPPFGSPAIPLADLWPGWLEAKRDGELTKQPTLAVEG